jgi:hypothetical protein
VNNAVGYAETFQVAPHNLGVRRVVFHEQYGDGFSVHDVGVSWVLFSSLVNRFSRCLAAAIPGCRGAWLPAGSLDGMCKVM